MKADEVVAEALDILHEKLNAIQSSLSGGVEDVAPQGWGAGY